MNMALPDEPEDEKGDDRSRNDLGGSEDRDGDGLPDDGPGQESSGSNPNIIIK